MSEETTTQAVVDDPKASAKPDAAVSGARDDGDELDKLLAEFPDSAATKEAPASTQPEQKTGTADQKTQPDMGRLSAIEQRLFKQDMKSTIDTVRGSLDAELFDDDIVESWINAEAKKDPRLATAWVNRDSNPKAFQKVVDQLGRNFAKKYGRLPDKAATDDREAVTAAVRGASTKAPEGKAPDFAGMSNAEYREAHKKEYGYYPSV